MMSHEHVLCQCVDQRQRNCITSSSSERFLSRSSADTRQCIHACGQVNQISRRRGHALKAFDHSFKATALQ